MTNFAVLVGRFTSDLELRELANGKNVMNFTLAVQRGADKADFIDCVAWDATATLIRRFGHKGGRIAVSGPIETRTWKDNDGKSRKEVYVRVHDFTAIDFNEDEKKPEGKPWKPTPDVVEDQGELPF